jgi:hypothetical protein
MEYAGILISELSQGIMGKSDPLSLESRWKASISDPQRLLLIPHDMG